MYKVDFKWILDNYWGNVFYYIIFLSESSGDMSGSVELFISSGEISDQFITSNVHRSTLHEDLASGSGDGNILIY